MERAVKLSGSVLAFGAHGHVLCLDLMFYHRKGGLRAAKETVEIVKEDLEGGNQKVLSMFRVEAQALTYVQRPGVYSPDRRRGEFFRALGSKMGIYFWGKEATWYSIL